jgi:hypothetical protein
MSPTMSRQHRQSGSYYQQSARTPVLSDDEEQNSDGLEDTFSDDDDEDELFHPDESSESDDDDLDEDGLDDAKIEALFAPTTGRAGGKRRRFPPLAEIKESCKLGKADFKAFIDVEKLMIKRKWSFQHVILLYTRFGRATKRSQGVSHAVLHYKEISNPIIRYAGPSSLAQLLAPSIRREWKRLVHNPDQPFSKARDSNSSGLLDVKHLSDCIGQDAPLWFALMNLLLRNQRAERQTYEGTKTEGKEFEERLVFITSHVLGSFAPRSSSEYRSNLGLFLHSCGLSRKGLDTLAGMGVILSYTHLNKRLTRIAKNTEVLPTQDSLFSTNISSRTAFRG